MGWLVMGERELNRIELLPEVGTGRLRVEDAAGLLGLTRRQVLRLLARFRTDGPAGLVYRARGRAPNNALPAVHQEQVLALVRTQHADFGPTLAAGKLSRLHDIHISHATLRKWMIEGGLWRRRKHRQTLHQPQPRREALGELVQIDGSKHRWFEDRGPGCTLLVFIDDATGKLMHLRFVRSESTFSYFNALEGYFGTTAGLWPSIRTSTASSG